MLQARAYNFKFQPYAAQQTRMRYKLRSSELGTRGSGSTSPDPGISGIPAFYQELEFAVISSRCSAGGLTGDFGAGASVAKNNIPKFRPVRAARFQPQHQ